MIVAFPPAARPQRYYFLDRPEWTGGDPTKRAVEVINGTEVEKKMGAFETGLANALNVALADHLRTTGLGRAFVGMEIELPGTTTRVKPDVCVVSADTWPLDRRIPGRSWWLVAPDLAVESVSPYELTHATLAKVHDYFDGGVKAVWLILPNVEQVYCYSSPTAVRIFSRGDELTGDPVVPGFRMSLADLFPPAEPEPPA
jgi:Uma2 family endonuclease